MTLQPVVPTHLLTVAEYLEIGELESGYSELDGGRLLVSPSPKPRHNRAGYRMGVQLDGFLPTALTHVLDMDVDLQLAPPDAPGTVRRPDLVITTWEAMDRVNEEEKGVLLAHEALVVVEIVSPGSKRTDQVQKRSEYAEAGIPQYWIVDLTPPTSLLACHQAGDFGYVDSGAVTDTFTTTQPFPLTIDLNALR